VVTNSPGFLRKPTFGDLISVSFFSIFGVLFRISLTNFGDWAYQGETNSVLRSFGSDFLLQNMIGSALRGLFVAHRNGISLFHPALFIGVTSGLCASLTTFSSWNEQASLEMVAGRDMNAFLILTLGFTVYLGFFRFGTQTGELHASKHGRVYVWTLTIVALSAVFTVIVLATLGTTNSAILAAFGFGPVGAILRLYLDYGLNSLEMSKAYGFPVGTFLANWIGCIISGSMRVLTDRAIGPAWVVSALSVGLAGSLSTVSSFLLEIERFPHRHHRYIYAFGSIFLCQLTLAVINTARFYKPF